MLRIDPFHFTEEVVTIYAFHKKFLDVSALSIFDREPGSIMVDASHHHSFIRVAVEFFIHLVVFKLKFDGFKFGEVVLWEVHKIKLFSWDVVCIIGHIPYWLQISS